MLPSHSCPSESLAWEFPIATFLLYLPATKRAHVSKTVFTTSLSLFANANSMAPERTEMKQFFRSWACSTEVVCLPGVTKVLGLLASQCQKKKKRLPEFSQQSMSPGLVN